MACWCETAESKGLGDLPHIFKIKRTTKQVYLSPWLQVTTQSWCARVKWFQSAPYSRLIFCDYSTLSQSKWLENHTPSSGTYPYSQYVGVTPPGYKHKRKQRKTDANLFRLAAHLVFLWLFLFNSSRYCVYVYFVSLNQWLQPSHSPPVFAGRRHTSCQKLPASCSRPLLLSWETRAASTRPMSPPMGEGWNSKTQRENWYRFSTPFQRIHRLRLKVRLGQEEQRKI